MEFNRQVLPAFRPLSKWKRASQSANKRTATLWMTERMSTIKCESSNSGATAWWVVMPETIAKIPDWMCSPWFWCSLKCFELKKVNARNMKWNWAMHLQHEFYYHRHSLNILIAWIVMKHAVKKWAIHLIRA